MDHNSLKDTAYGSLNFHPPFFSLPPLYHPSSLFFSLSLGNSTWNSKLWFFVLAEFVFFPQVVYISSSHKKSTIHRPLFHAQTLILLTLQLLNLFENKNHVKKNIYYLDFLNFRTLWGKLHS